MITTVCLNPAIDQSGVVECLQFGGTNRMNEMRSEIGGKGINVAIVLNRLHTDVRSVSCVGHEDADFFIQGMAAAGVAFDMIPVSGGVRRNLKVIENESRRVTELNQQGARVDAEALKRLCDTLALYTEPDDCIALCGSLPPGCGPDTYQTMMHNLPGRRWVVDASGDVLCAALRQNPFLIKPNKPELEEIAGCPLADVEAVRNAAAALCKAGVGYAAVSLGEQGALITDGNRSLYAPAVPVSAAFTVGAGDAMLAGILYGIGNGETVFDSLRYGIAAGAACVEGGSIHAFDQQRFSALVSKVDTRML